MLPGFDKHHGARLIRLSTLPLFQTMGGVVFTLAALPGAMGALVAHDLIALRRIHPERAGGSSCILALLLAAHS